MYAVLAALRSGCHLLSVLVPPGWPAGMLISRTGCWFSAIVSLQLLSQVVIIVPDLFRAPEGLTSDDVQAWRVVIHNKVLRRHVAGRGREGSRWRGNRSCEMGDAWSTARPSGDGA
jgi:hypothetical protein